ncbi:MAG: transposase, partial [Proteobacteria bacterium]|nr:transposase [Pseudomonadota bacterium]
PLRCTEGQMLFERLDRLGSQDMLVLDRGYPGGWLVAVLLQWGIPFCMRCDFSSTFTASPNSCRQVTGA